jgi:hypothetical protein
MLKQIFILVFLICSPVLAQDKQDEVVEEEIEVTLPGSDEEKIQMEVNSYFSENFNNVYYTADFRARIVVNIQPLSYSEMKIQFEVGIPTPENAEVIEKGELIKEGVTLLYFKFVMDGEEEKMAGVGYYKERNEGEIYTIVGSYPAAHKAIYEPIVLKAALTANLN